MCQRTMRLVKYALRRSKHEVEVEKRNERTTADLYILYRYITCICAYIHVYMYNQVFQSSNSKRN